MVLPLSLLEWLYLYIPVRLIAKSNQNFLMNFATIVVITVISTLSLYIFFLVVGVGGIDKNRNAQGLDQK